MNYYKLCGITYDTFYALDKENASCATVEIRYYNEHREAIDSVVLTQNSALRGTYDSIAAEAIEKYEKISEKDFKAVKRVAQEWMKEMEAFNAE